jgi:hypothetical protein
MIKGWIRQIPLVRLGALTAAALLIHGYHYGVEDSEIFIPAAHRLLHPELFPYASEFFLAHQRLSVFSPLLAWTAGLTHLSMVWTVFLWYVVSVFLTLAACWMLAATCFESARARWCAVLVTTAVLTMPAANTGLLLIDPYLTPRSLSTPLTVFTLALILQRRLVAAGIAVVITGLIHPQMAVYLVVLAGGLFIFEKSATTERKRIPVMASFLLVLPAGFHFAPAQGPYREALYARDYYFLSNWCWYDWLGMLAPLAILAWFWKGNLRGTTPAFRRLSMVLIPFGLCSILVAAVFASSADFDTFARLQPLRCFHLVTLVFVVLLGGVIGEYAGKDRAWVAPALFVALACGMFFVARQTYPDSAQVEWPWLTTSSNPWVDTLLWVRRNTPEDAVFAVDSRYFKEPEVDVHGFRTISERSELADYYKDGGVVALFPELAVEWKEMTNATYGLNHFDAQDFTRLAGRYPVTWTVIHGAAPTGMDCPYQERGYAVCRIARARVSGAGDVARAQSNAKGKSQENGL